jgi:dTDP-4-amino-4,6-dideoxygalactose transaminase
MERIAIAQPSWDDEMRNAALTTLDSLRWVKGEQGHLFGKEFAQMCGAVHATPCQSGSVALWAALRLLGIGPGDEVIVPSLTYIATTTCVSLVGATPIFVDVEPDFWCIDLEQVKKAYNEHTKAVIGVHLFGQMYDPELIEWCKTHDVALIEDAAQAHGASLVVDGVQRGAGACGDIGIFSFFPSKNMAVGGEGGMLTTTLESISNRMQAFVNHGRDATLESFEVGSNLRMSEVSAAIGRIQLKRLERWVERRCEIAGRYSASLCNMRGFSIPAVRKHSNHAWHQYCVLAEQPLQLKQHLDHNGIDARIYYATPCHRQKVFEDHPQYESSLKWTDELGPKLVAIPVHHQLRDEEVEYIIEKMIEFSTMVD